MSDTDNPYEPPQSAGDGGSKPSHDQSPKILPLTAAGCILVLVTAFLGWFFAGVQLSISTLVMRDAAKDLLSADFEERGIEESSDDQLGQEERQDNKKSREGLVGKWFGYMIVAFLLGAAAGGYLFGQIGDRFGRTKGMAFSILWYSIWSGLTCFVQDPQQLLVMRFITCMGVGGMWPNGIALASEAWPNISRPFLAGVIGTAANIGIFLFATLAAQVDITAESWRWALLIGAIPVVLGVFVLVAVPESPRWLALREKKDEKSKEPEAAPAPMGEVFKPPLLTVTVVGIMLGAIPLFGGWGCANWITPWASEVGEQTNPPDPGLKARITQARSFTGSVASLLGGALGMLLGRKLCYCLLSVGALASAQYLFWFLEPQQTEFLIWSAILGFFSGAFFGWLPLCLPEMFPTRARSTGAGVSFNFGRILTAVGVLLGALLISLFEGDYAKIGRVTSLAYAAGVIVIWFAPIGEKKALED